MAIYRSFFRPDWFGDSPPFIRSLSATYGGFKTLCLTALILVFGALDVAVFVHGAIPGLTRIIEWRVLATFLEYVFLYWTTHPGLLTVFALGCLFLLYFDAARPIYKRFCPEGPPIPSEEEIAAFTRKAALFTSIVFVLLATFTVPLLHLCIPKWLRVATTVFTAILTLVPLFVSPKQDADGARLGKFSFPGFSFPGNLYFDTAGIGPKALEIQRELERFAQIRESPLGNKVADYLRQGDSESHWNGYHSFFQELAVFFGVPIQRFVLHENTTKAIEHALYVAVDGKTHIVTSDLDYRSVRRVSEERVSKSRFHCLPLREELIHHHVGQAALIDRIVSHVRRVKNDNPDARIIVVASHVCYETGLVMDISQLFEQLTSVPGTLLIVDGAQAAGNIEVNASVLDKCHFYATSGHKWICGVTTLGILIFNEQKCQEIGIEAARIRSVTRAFSTYDYELDYSSETINLEPFVSSNAMLIEYKAMGGIDRVAQRNRMLANEFIKHVSVVRNVSVIHAPAASGIVALQSADAGAIYKKLEEECGIVVGRVRGSEETTLRFSFHYFMTLSDVYNLVRSLMKIARALRSERD